MSSDGHAVKIILADARTLLVNSWHLEQALLTPHRCIGPAHADVNANPAHLTAPEACSLDAQTGGHLSHLYGSHDGP